MAFTRNKNTAGNYCLFLRQNYGIEDWQLYKNGANGTAYDTRLAGNGLNPGQLPWNTLSHNPADIESFLFGINASAGTSFTPNKNSQSNTLSETVIPC